MANCPSGHESADDLVGDVRGFAIGPMDVPGDRPRDRPQAGNPRAAGAPAEHAQRSPPGPPW